MRSLRPLTERILGRLPGPWPAWVAVWAVLPWLNAGANLLLDEESRSPVWEQDGVVIVLNYAALSLAIVLTVWGAREIARRLETLEGTIASVVDEPRRFQEVNTIAVPLVGAAALAVAFGASTLVEDGWWTRTPLRRRYFELTLEDGSDAVVFSDPDGRWFRQRD